MTRSLLLFNPSRLDREELEATFVGRSPTVARLVRDLVADARGDTSRHWVVVAPRGYGKSHLVEIVARRMEQDQGWAVVRLPEEHYQVGTLADLLEQIVARLEGGPSPFADEADADRVVERALDRLRRREDPRLLVVVENLGDLLAKLGTKDERRLREILMRDAPFVVVATSPVAVATGVKDTFHDFFQPLSLDELGAEEVKALVDIRMQRDGATELLSRREEVLARVDALLHFSGGNPRLVLALYAVLREGITGSLYDELLELLDRVTPYYQARIGDVAPQMARVLTEMCVAEGPLTPAELGRRTRLKTNQVTALLARLVDARLVRPTGRPDKRSRYYEVIDRLFRIWLQMREDRSSRKRLRFLAEFYDRWFGGYREEAWRLAKRLASMFWSDAGEGNAARARDWARTLEHLEQALGLAESPVLMVLDGEAPGVPTVQELANLERQYHSSESDEERAALALGFVEGWNARGFAERAANVVLHPELPRVPGPVGWRLQCWHLAFQLGLRADADPRLIVQGDEPPAIAELLRSWAGPAEIDIDLILDVAGERGQQAMLWLLSVLCPQQLLTRVPGVLHLPGVQLFLVGAHTKPTSSHAWILKCWVARGYRGILSVIAARSLLASTVGVEVASWMASAQCDWTEFRESGGAVPNGFLVPYQRLRAAGFYTEDLEPWATVLRVRDAADPAAALAALHPEEREAVRLVLEAA